MSAPLLAEYRTQAALLQAIAALRGKGYRQMEAYTPYPVHGLDEALGQPASRLPWVVLVAGLGAAALAYGLQWLLNAFLYPINVGGRPPHFFLSYIPITFEMGILFASFAAFFGVLWCGRLLRLYQPVFETRGFESATNDAFWLCVLPADPQFEPTATERDLAATEPLRVTPWSQP